MADETDLRADLEGALPGEVSARQLAAAALERGSLADYYPDGFGARLTDSCGDAAEAPRTVAAWIEAVRESLSGPPVTADRLFLGLVLASEEFAREFAGRRPEAAGFERACAAFTDELSHESKERWDDLVGQCPTSTDRRRLPAMARAVDCGEAEFSQFSEARSYQQEKFMPGRESANRTYLRFYPVIRAAFETRHGRVLEEFWCEDIAVGVVRTAGGPGKSRLHFDGDYDESVSEIINRCKQVNWRALQFLPPTEYETVVRDLYGLLTDLFAIMDRKAVLDADGNATYKVDPSPFLEKLGTLEKGVEDATARRGQRWYIAGMTIGLASLSVLLGLLALLSLGDWRQIFEGAIFGAAGALASVLYRMHQGDLEIEAQQGRMLVYVGALIRPLTGALFGGAICALLLSGLLPVEIPDADPERFYFLGVLAFAAGFSERWAPELLQQTAEGLSTKKGEKTGEKDGERGTAVPA